MGFNRDKVVNLLPWSLVETIDYESKWGVNNNGYTGPGILSLVKACFKEPRNPVEADAHRDLIGLGCVPLKSGWPDFFVFGPKGDLFLVEVKSDTDSLSPQQRVIHELLAAKGIDVYVRWGNENPHYQAIGASTPWDERFVR